MRFWPFSLKRRKTVADPVPAPAPVPVPAPVPKGPTVQVTGTVTLTLNGKVTTAPFVGTFVMPTGQVTFNADSSVTADSSQQV